MSDETLVVTVRDLAAGGDGVADLPGDRGVVFVPCTAPGDRVRVRLLPAGAARRWRRGNLDALLVPSPDRVRPICPVADRCGGCVWQHVAYPVQLAAKARLFARAFRVAGLSVGAPEPVPAPTPLSYRCRARLLWRPGPSGGLGFRAARSDALVAVRDCPVLLPALRQRLVSLERALGAHELSRRRALTVHLLGNEAGECSVGIEWARLHRAPSGSRRRGRDRGRHRVYRRTRRGPDSRQESALLGLAKVLFEDGNLALSGSTWVESDGLERVAAGDPCLDIAPPGGLPLLATPADFAQANPRANEALRHLVARWVTAGPARLVLELFAGSGNLTQALRAAGVEALTAVEASPSAVTRGREAVGPPVTWISGDAEQAVGQWAEDAGGRAPDVVVLDPPRTGAQGLVAPLAELGPERLLYVSCDAMTLARDAALLGERGYAARRLALVDTLPQTAHFEGVLELTRQT